MLTRWYNTGIVNGKQYVGGVAGYYSGLTNLLKYCYNAGFVDSLANPGTYKGSVIGYRNNNNPGTMQSFYISPFEAHHINRSECL